MERKFEKTVKLGPDNPYYRDSSVNFLALAKLVAEHKTQYFRLLSTGRYKYLGDWVNSLLPQLADPVVRVSTKVKWVLEGITEFPKCAVCGKDSYYRTYNVSLGYSYPRTCCIECQNNDPVRKARLIESNRRKYGYDWPKQNPDVQRRDKAKLLEKLGVENVFQLEDIKNKAKKTNVLRHGNPNWRNGSKISKTRRSFSPEKKAAALEAFRRTCRESLGVDFPLQSKDIRDKASLTYLHSTGYSHPAQNPDVRRRLVCEYSYGGESFDSMDELAFYIYSSDMGFPVDRSRKGITYEYKGHKFTYFPDFVDRVTGALIEIKGAHFFRPDGTMFCPYREKEWTDEQYAYVCGKYEAKHQCMLENEVLIIKTDSDFMHSIMSYIEKNYPPGYLAGFKVCSGNA